MLLPWHADGGLQTELPEISRYVDGAEFAEAVKQVQIAVSGPDLPHIGIRVKWRLLARLLLQPLSLAMREIK